MKGVTPFIFYIVVHKIQPYKYYITYHQFFIKIHSEIVKKAC